MEKLKILVLVWFILILLWWSIIYGHAWKNVHIKSVNQWDAGTAPRSALRMWVKYGNYGMGHQRFLRTIAYVLIYFAFASFLFTLLGAPSSPCRGDACVIDKAVIGVSVLAMLVLLFMVVDAARLCICWVDSMREFTLDWAQTRKDEVVQRLRLPDSHAIAWIKVHLIGDRTSEITRLIYYPVLIILLMLLARSTYFDKWDFPQALGIVVGLNFVIALTSIVRLNYVAKSVREDILRRLQDEQLAGDKKPEPSYAPNPTERQALIEQLKGLEVGAYMRVWDQPAVRATLLLLGGVALTSAEYLAVVLR